MAILKKDYYYQNLVELWVYPCNPFTSNKDAMQTKILQEFEKRKVLRELIH